MLSKNEEVQRGGMNHGSDASDEGRSNNWTSATEAGPTRLRFDDQPSGGTHVSWMDR